MNATLARLFVASALLVAARGFAAVETSPGLPMDLAARVQSRAPLALSADGQWRLHVDAHRVLHRARLDGAGLPTSVGLALTIRAMAVSADGRRAALVADSGCVAVADFDAAGPRSVRVRWLDDERLAQDAVAWTDMPAPRCLATPERQAEIDNSLHSGLGLAVVALSPDGRTLALRAGVVDLAASRVALRLPEAMALRNEPWLLRLAFLADGRQLLAVSAETGWDQNEGSYEAAGDVAAVWELPSGRLLRLGPVASLQMPKGPPAEMERNLPQDVELTCGAALTLPQSVLSAGTHTLSDPRGRWIATVAWDGNDYFHRGDTGAIGVARVDNDREFATFKLKQDVRGLAASADGSAIYGLATGAAGALSAVTDGPGRLLDDGVVELRVPPPGLAPRAEATAAWPAKACGGAGESVDARRVTTTRTPLAAVWRRPITGRYEARTAAFPDLPSTACTDYEDAHTVFVRRDGSVWLDEFTSAERIDPATGGTLQRLPVLRQRDVCALPLPAADGFVTWQGDSLTLRTFDPKDGGRRALDVRPGWRVASVATLPSYVLAVWEAKPDIMKTQSAAAQAGDVMPVHVVAYDNATGKRLGDVFQEDPLGETENWSPPRDPLPMDEATARASRCRPPPGPRDEPWSLQVDVFGSLRADHCDAPDAAPRTAFWTGLDLGLASPGTLNPDESQREVMAAAGAIGVVRDDRVLRVFDLPQRRELGRIALADAGARAVTILPTQGLVLVESDEGTTDGKSYQRYLRAYAIPR